MKKLVRRLKTAGLSNTTNHKNLILKYEGILEQNGQGSLALLSRWLLLKVLKVELFKIPKIVGA
jgi:hypothetical protein